MWRWLGVKIGQYMNNIHHTSIHIAFFGWQVGEPSVHVVSKWTSYVVLPPKGIVSKVSNLDCLVRSHQVLKPSFVYIKSVKINLGSCIPNKL